METYSSNGNAVKPVNGAVNPATGVNQSYIASDIFLTSFTTFDERNEGSRPVSPRQNKGSLAKQVNQSNTSMSALDSANVSA